MAYVGDRPGGLSYLRYTRLMRLWMIALCFATGLLAADVASDGSRVHYESYGKGQEAVVFIHGWTCDLTFWRGQAPVYEKHRALLVDLPGHGQSEKPEVAYTEERFARAIDAVMRDAGVTRAAKSANGTLHSLLQGAELPGHAAKSDRGNVLGEDDARAARGDPHEDGGDAAARDGVGLGRHVRAGSAEGGGDVQPAGDGDYVGVASAAGVRSAAAHGV